MKNIVYYFILILFAITFVSACAEGNNEEDILSFVLNVSEEKYEGVINDNNQIIVDVPYGTDISSLKPEITIPDNKNISPDSIEAKDFSEPVTYILTSKNGSTKSYTVIVKVAPNDKKDIINIDFGLGEKIERENFNLLVTVPAGTDITDLKPVIEISERAVIEPESGARQDFSNPVNYKVTAEDGTANTFIVKVSIDEEEQAGETVSEEQRTEDVIESLSSKKELLGFKFVEPEITGTISGSVIELTVPYGADITSLTPIITISEKASINPVSGVELDFSETVTFTVTAEDGSQKEYLVEVNIEEKIKSSAKEVLSFKLQTRCGRIFIGDIQGNEIKVIISTRTDIFLASTKYTLSKGAAKGDVLRLSDKEPAKFVVVAEDGSVDVYTVTIKRIHMLDYPLYDKEEIFSELELFNFQRISDNSAIYRIIVHRGTNDLIQVTYSQENDFWKLTISTIDRRIPVDLIRDVLTILLGHDKARNSIDYIEMAVVYSNSVFATPWIRTYHRGSELVVDVYPSGRP